jgi:hypothetical protein
MANEEGTNVVPMGAAIDTKDLGREPGSLKVLPAVFDFAPRSFDEAMQLADRLATSTMVPKAFVGNPGNILIAMQWGAEVGLKPLQSIQNIAVINGKPGLYGDAGKALLLDKGCQIEERDVQEVRETGIASCTITRKGRPPLTRTFSIEDAQTAGLWGKEGPWRTYPYRQMAWRAFWFAARDGAADILRGMGGVEELRDLPPVEEREIEGSAVVTPAQQSKTAKMAEQLRVVKLPEVEKAFTDATDGDTLSAAVELAKKLTNTDDKIKAGDAYKAALARLKGPPPDKGPSLADIRSMLTKANQMGDVNAANTALSMIAGAEGEPDLKSALTADARAVIAKLTPAT